MNRMRLVFAGLAVCSIFTAGCLETEGYSDSGPHAYVEVGSDNFESAVLNSDMPVMVDFWATWCGPCVALAPTVEDVASEYSGKAVIAKLDVDQAEDIAGQYGVSSIPTLIFFKNGEEVHRMVGPNANTAKNEISKQLDSMMD